jgi:hypothetical protein
MIWENVPQKYWPTLEEIGKIPKNSAIDSFFQAEYDSETIETFPRVVRAGKIP